MMGRMGDMCRPLRRRFVGVGFRARYMASTSEVDLEVRRLRQVPVWSAPLAALYVLAWLCDEGVLRQQVARNLLAVGASQVAGDQGTCRGP